MIDINTFLAQLDGIASNRMAKEVAEAKRRGLSPELIHALEEKMLTVYQAARLRAARQVIGQPNVYVGVAAKMVQ